jgi:ATP-dependent helicase/nuclease subunit A
LDLTGIAAFWNSEVGQALLKHREHLYRELPFTFRLSLEEAREFQAQNVLAVQGASSSDQAGQKSSRLSAERASTASVVVPSQCGASPSSVAALENEFVVVTGIADVVVLSPDEIWCLDFKTDDVTPDEWEHKAREYAPQMRLYALALSRIYRRPVTRRWLHSLTLRRTLDVK